MSDYNELSAQDNKSLSPESQNETLGMPQKGFKNAAKFGAYLPRAILIALVSLSFLSACIAGALTLVHTPGPLQNTQAIDIKPGTPAVKIISKLDDMGAISYPAVFMLLYQMSGQPIRAGEFEIPSRSSPSHILRILTRGHTIQYSLTLIEGVSVHTAYKLLAKTSRLSGELPDFVPEEGMLAASTYFYVKGESRRDIVARMQALQHSRLDNLWHLHTEDHPLKTKQEILILASIIEKETSYAGERRRVAGVFTNRLRRGMRLQSDPTVIYGLTLGKKKLGRRLTQSDLKRDTPYNTYTRKGLPISAISIPGAESIEAALNPEEHDFLYFVANGKGGHNFGRTLQEHNRNVVKWREFRDSSS